MDVISANASNEGMDVGTGKTFGQLRLLLGLGLHGETPGRVTGGAA